MLSARKFRASWFAASAAGLVLAGAPAQACAVMAELDPRDVGYANLVVVGRVSNYRMVLDPVARRERKELLAKSSDLSPAMRKMLAEQTEFVTDYARFDVTVDEALVGEPPKTLSVTWDNSTFDEPEAMPPGPFLIALRDPRAALPPLRGPSGTIFANREPTSPTVLQAPCAPAFMFDATSQEARAVRQILAAGGAKAAQPRSPHSPPNAPPRSSTPRP